MNRPATRAWAGALLAALFCLAGVSIVLGAQQPAEHHHPQAAAPAAAPPTDAPALHIPDTAVLDQDGERLHFYTDLVKGKVVAVNFIFTSCTTICPPLAATFSKLQDLFGARVGKEIFLISVSVDPAVDTPPRLKAWAAKFNARPGWTLVTGDKAEIDRLLRALGVPPGRPEDHPALVLIGNEARGAWVRAYGLAPATRLAELIEQAAAGQNQSSAKETGGKP